MGSNGTSGAGIDARGELGHSGFGRQRTWRRFVQMLLVAPVMTGLAQHSAGHPSKQPKQHLFPAVTGSMEIDVETVLAAKQVLEQIETLNTGPLPGEPDDAPGLSVHMHAMIDRAREAGNGGDIMLVNAVLNLYHAKLDNGQLEKRVSTADFSPSALARMDGETLYDIERRRLADDPAPEIIADREHRCESAIQDMVGPEIAPPKVPQCEEADVNPPIGGFPLEVVDPKWLQDKPNEKHAVGAGCESALRYALENVSLISLSVGGILGRDISRERIDEARAFCSSAQDQAAWKVVNEAFLLKLEEMDARLHALQVYTHRKISVRTNDDYDEWVRQSWIEVDRAATVKSAMDVEAACMAGIDAAFNAGGDPAQCPDHGAGSNTPKNSLQRSSRTR